MVTNHRGWGAAYLADTMELDRRTPDVAREFAAGNFLVKESDGVFNQVHTDMALEHNKL